MDNYKRICQETYHNFEIYNLRAIDALDLGEINSKDLQILIFIQGIEQGVTPSAISNHFNMNNTALSNRLVHYEYLNLIRKKQNIEDSRSVLISLTELGVSKTTIYHEYVNGFIRYLRKHISLMKYPTTFKAIKKISAIILNQPVQALIKEDLSKEVLFDVQKYFSTIINTYIDESVPFIKDNDLFILTELFLHTHEQLKEMTYLSNKLLMPYQTLMSKIKKYKTLNYIDKKADGSYTFSAEILTVIQGYMHVRMVLYYEFFQKLETYEREQIKSIFQLLKTYAIDIISTRKQ